MPLGAAVLGGYTSRGLWVSEAREVVLCGGAADAGTDTFTVEV